MEHKLGPCLAAVSHNFSKAPMKVYFWRDFEKQERHLNITNLLFINMPL